MIWTLLGIAIAVLLASAFTRAKAEPAACPYDIHLSILYNYFTPAQRKLHDLMYDAAYKGKDFVPVPQGLSREDADEVIHNLWNEAAELCAYDYAKSEIITLAGGGMIVRLGYRYDLSVQEEFIGEVKNIAKRFEGLGDEKGIRAIHDYLILRFEYNYEFERKGREDTQFAHLALTINKAVCNGYAQTMSMLCHFAGYSCSYVTGMNHAWNIACINGRYKWIDATWDDAGKKPNLTWFAVDGAEMVKSHSVGPLYKVLEPLLSVLPEGVNFSLYLDVNGDAGFLRGITQDNPAAVYQEDLAEGEYYCPALYLYTSAGKDERAVISWDLDGKKGCWAESSVKDGLVFRLDEKWLKDGLGQHQIIWYYNGSRFAVYRWTVLYSRS